jgi:DNA-binding transcriptional ArsR family regulator
VARSARVTFPHFATPSLAPAKGWHVRFEPLHWMQLGWAAWRESMPFDHPIYVLKAEFFRILGHPTRVRILELLRDGERTVGDLQAALALDSSGTSQHLGALRKQGLLESRRAGTSVYYRIRDPQLLQLLEVARQILTSNLADTQALLHGLRDNAASEASGRRRPRAPRAT